MAIPLKSCAAIVLAAGRATRMPGQHKLLRKIAGAPVLAHTLGRINGLGLAETLVVTGRDQQDVAATATEAAPHARIVHNPAFAEGMGGSIAYGARALQTLWAGPDATACDVRGVFIVLGDMPAIAASVFAALADALAGPGAIAMPSHAGRRGHPVLFAQDLLPELAALTGDQGARAVVARHQDRVQVVATADPGILMDIDTPGDLSKVAAALSHGSV